MILPHDSPRNWTNLQRVDKRDMTADPASPRRRFQFRLRTLMIGVTVAAIAIGVLTGFHRMQVNADREAVKRALDEGRIKTDPYAPEWPVK
jgi:hypothetical protein